MQNPEPLACPGQEGAFSFDVHLSASLRPQGADEPATFCRTNFRHMYWSSAQELVHHAVGALRDGHAIHMPANGGINVAGTGESAIEKLSAAIARLRSVRDSRHPGDETRDEG